MPKPNVQRTSNLLASVTDEMLGGDLAAKLQDKTIRVERLLLELVRPHPVQLRRVLPERIHQAFHQQQLTPTQALRELAQIVQVAARQQSRPFTSVLDLLAQPEDESETIAELSPEETLLRDLVNLAVTIRDDGQVNPLTVVDVSEGVSHLYRIETGERRYWATWLLRDFIPDSNSDGTIPCIVIPAKTASVFRQAKENTSRSGLTAIAMARQAALRLLTVHNYEIPDYAVENDFYRQALTLDLRNKREHTEAILAAMGGIGRMHFSRYKALLQLSTKRWKPQTVITWKKAVLRHVIQLPSEAQSEMIQQIVQFDLTGKQVKEIIEHHSTSDLDDKPDAIDARLVKVMRAVERQTPEVFVQTLIREEKSTHLARARLQNMMTFLKQVGQLLPEENL